MRRSAAKNQEEPDLAEVLETMGGGWVLGTTEVLREEMGTAVETQVQVAAAAVNVEVGEMGVHGVEE